MVAALLAALKAIPRIVDAFERLADVGVAYVAQQRKEAKDEKVDSLIDDIIARHPKRGVPDDQA